MAQAAHAATAVCLAHTLSASSHSIEVFHRQVLHETRERQETIEYLADLRNMRKVSLEGRDFRINDTNPRRSCFRCAAFVLDVFSVHS